MVHDFRPAFAAAIRSGANRRGAVAALLGIIPLVSAGVMQTDGAHARRNGKRAAKSEGRKKTKAVPGPEGPQGPQGPEGARGATGPKAITFALARYERGCIINPGPGVCAKDCGPDEIPVSGGFSVPDPQLHVLKSIKTDNGWAIEVFNASTMGQGFEVIAEVYCMPK